MCKLFSDKRQHRGMRRSSILRLSAGALFLIGLFFCGTARSVQAAREIQVVTQEFIDAHAGLRVNMDTARSLNEIPDSDWTDPASSLTYTYANIGTYEGRAVGATLTAKAVTEGTVIQTATRAFGEGVIVRGTADLTYEYFYMDDPGTKLSMENAMMSIGSLADGRSQRQAEFITLLSNPTSPFYVSEDTLLTTATYNGVEMIGGAPRDGEGWIDDPEDLSYRRSTAAFALSGTSNTFRARGYDDAGGAGFWLTPNTYMFGFTPTERHTVTIRYLEEGTEKKLADPYTETLAKGETYHQGSPDIAGYSLVQDTQKNVSGTMEDADIVIDVYYVRDLKIETEVVNGVIDPTITGIKRGESHTISYHPNEGYLLSEISVDGKPVSDPQKTPSSYSFSQQTEDHTIRVVYEKQEDPVKRVRNETGADVQGKFVDAGSVLQYEIEVKNPTKQAYTYTLTDELPAHTVFLSASDKGKLTKGVVTWEIAVPAEESKTVSFRVRTDAKGVRIDNQATMQVGEITRTTNTVENWTPKDPTKTVLRVEKDIHREFCVAGEEIQYAISLENIATATKTFTVTDPIPAHLSFVSASDGGAVEKGEIRWKVQLAAGEKKTVTWVAKIEDTAKDTVIVNGAKLTVDEATEPGVPEADRPETPVLTDPVKRVTRDGKDIDGLLVGTHSTLEYTISVHNPAHDAKHFTVTDRVPAHTTLQSVADDGVDRDGILTWEFTLQPDETKEVHFTVETDAEKDVHIPNKGNAAVDAVDLDSNTVENWIPPQPIKSVADEKGENIEFGILKAGDGRRVRYTIRFRNPANTEKTFIITDPLPAALRTIETEDGGIYDEEHRTIRWEKILAPEEEGSVHFTAELETTLSSTPEGIVNNVGIVASDLWEDSEDERIHLEDEDIKLSIPVKKDWVYQEGVDPLPPASIDVELLNATNGQHVSELTLRAANHWEGVFRNVPGIVNGESMTYIVREKEVEGYIATVSGTMEEGFLVTNRPGSRAPVKAVLDAAGTSIEGKTVSAGEELTYQISWVNLYDETVSLQIIDPIPEGTTFLSAGQGGQWRESRKEVQWEIGEVRPQETVTVTWVAVVDEKASEKIQNLAKVRSDRDPSFISTNTTTNPIDPGPLPPTSDPQPTKAPADTPASALTPEPVLTPEVTPTAPTETTVATPTPTTEKTPQGTPITPPSAGGSSQQAQAVKTGDVNHNAEWLLLLAAATATLMGMIFFRTRRRHR